MKTKFLLYFLKLSVLMSACITPISDFEQIASKKFLVIEAAVSDQPGPHEVKLYFSSEKIEDGIFIPIIKAKVYVMDEKGVREEFVEGTLEGTYFSSSKFVGRVGSTYTLNIETTDGKKYQSLPETMKSVPEIENLITRFEVNDNYGKGDERRVGFNIYLDFQDPAISGDNYQWYWKHYQRTFICETCVDEKYDPFRKACVPIPFDDPDGLPGIVTYLCDGDCWDISFSTDLNVFSDTYLNGQRVTGKRVARVPYDGDSPYYLQFEQRAITKNTYNHYQSLKAQTQNNGTLFDVPAETKFSFNVKSTTNPEEKILGHFDVYAVRKRIFYIDRTIGVPKDELPVKNIPPGKPPKGKGFFIPPRVECKEGLFRTPFKPEGWKE
jgi:Domain of unknown function (DUF4249)